MLGEIQAFVITLCYHFMVTLGHVEKGCRHPLSMQIRDKVRKREKKRMLRRGRKRQQRKDGRMARAGEASQQGNERQADWRRNALYQKLSSGLCPCLITVLIQVFCAMLLLLGTFAQQILTNSQLSMHHAGNTPGQLQLPFQTVLEIGKRNRDLLSHQH